MGAELLRAAVETDSPITTSPSAGSSPSSSDDTDRHRVSTFGNNVHTKPENVKKDVSSAAKEAASIAGSMNAWRTMEVTLLTWDCQTSIKRCAAFALRVAFDQLLPLPVLADSVGVAQGLDRCEMHCMSDKKRVNGREQP